MVSADHGEKWVGGVLTQVGTLTEAFKCAGGHGTGSCAPRLMQTPHTGAALGMSSLVRT